MSLPTVSNTPSPAQAESSPADVSVLVSKRTKMHVDEIVTQIQMYLKAITEHTWRHFQATKHIFAFL